MYHRIVMTAGISVLTNRRKKIEEKYPDFFTRSDRITEENKRIIEEIIRFVKNDIFKEPFHEKLSAEISLIAALKNQNSLHKKPVIIIFHTDTVKGVISAEIIKEIMEKQYSAEVTLKKIHEVDVSNRNLLSKSIGYFLSELSSELENGEPTSTCFAPIGGYKVMTSLGYLVGAFYQYPTVYLHEGSSIIHQIPPVKIQIDEDFIRENHLFLRKMLRETIVSMKGLSDVEKEIIRKEPAFFTVADDLVELNPFGQFICKQEKFAHYFQSYVSMEQSVLQELKKKYPSYRENAMQEISDLVERHKQCYLKENQGILFHEKAFGTLNKSEINAHLYKGGNSPVFRAVWQYEENEDRYYIGKIWFDHEDYERQVATYLTTFDIKKMVWEDITNKVYTS